MKQKKVNQKKILFSKINYLLLIVSIFSIFIGFSLMTCGGSDNPNEFNPEIFNFTSSGIMGDTVSQNILQANGIEDVFSVFMEEIID